ncbi:hypothetical protein C6501_16755 [Candidatus Poribacteria bacterium]|nr:MAG: hypothetical protein C6501_16755 [Candidatus Poribacteria bacterium]
MNCATTNGLFLFGLRNKSKSLPDKGIEGAGPIVIACEEKGPKITTLAPFTPQFTCYTCMQ